MIRRVQSTWPLASGMHRRSRETGAGAISGNRLSFGSAITSRSASTPLRPTGATMPNSARWTNRIDHRGLLADEQMAGAMQHQQLLLRKDLVSIIRTFARQATASQMASASAASFFWRLT